MTGRTTSLGRQTPLEVYVKIDNTFTYDVDQNVMPYSPESPFCCRTRIKRRVIHGCLGDGKWGPSGKVLFKALLVPCTFVPINQMFGTIPWLAWQRQILTCVQSQLLWKVHLCYCEKRKIEREWEHVVMTNNKFSGCCLFYFVLQNIKAVFHTNLALSAEEMNKEMNKCSKSH